VAGRSDTRLLAASAIAIVCVDQLSKSMVASALGASAPTSRLDLIGTWLAIEYAENRGAAFGLFSGISTLLPLIGIALVAALLVHYASEATPPIVETLALGAVIGGAVGNVIDRLRLGFVVDFIAVGPWPNFNVADSAVTVGVLVLIWNWVRVDRRHESPRPR
jgi:signal peptidase II